MVNLLIICKVLSVQLMDISCHWLRKNVSNDDDDKGNDYDGSRDNNNTKNPIFLLLNAFRNSFLNTKLKSATMQDIDNIIKSLKPKDAYGCDGVCTKSLKISCVFISSHLNHASNIMFIIRNFSSVLKIFCSETIIQKR